MPFGPRPKTSRTWFAVVDFAVVDGARLDGWLLRRTRSDLRFRRLLGRTPNPGSPPGPGNLRLEDDVGAGGDRF
jgi:hypothetical protein